MVRRESWHGFAANSNSNELARLMGVAMLLSMVPNRQRNCAPKDGAHGHGKPPSELAAQIRRVYQPLIEAEQQG